MPGPRIGHGATSFWLEALGNHSLRPPVPYCDFHSMCGTGVGGQRNAGKGGLEGGEPQVQTCVTLHPAAVMLCSLLALAPHLVAYCVQATISHMTTGWRTAAPADMHGTLPAFWGLRL